MWGGFLTSWVSLLCTLALPYAMHLEHALYTVHDMSVYVIVCPLLSISFGPQGKLNIHIVPSFTDE